MELQGRKLYVRALLAGSLGFVTFGWDAGVLGGILLTPEFQAAVGVSSSKNCLITIADNLHRIPRIRIRYP